MTSLPLSELLILDNHSPLAVIKLSNFFHKQLFHLQNYNEQLKNLFKKPEIPEKAKEDSPAKVNLLETNPMVWGVATAH